MGDTFDYQIYMQQVNHFINEMIHVVSETNVNIARFTAPVAEILRIGRIEASFYERPEVEMKEPFQVLVLYSMSAYDSERFAFYREIIANGNVIHFRFYQIIGDPPRNEEENSRLFAFERLMTVFMQRCRMKGLIDYFLNNDPQLNMYNIRFLLERLGVLASERKLAKYTVCYFNLKQFSLVNEFVGRDRGTQVMRDFIQKFKEIFTSEDEIVCRMGGDNFVALFYNEHLDEVLHILSGTKIQVSFPTKVELIISASVGVYPLTDEPVLPTDIMDRVSVANKVAQNDRRKSVAYFDDQMLYVENDAKRVQTMFPIALNKEEFHVYYQPKVFLENAKLSGAEALCRWIHDDELIAPDKFIPVFERKGLIGRLDFYMLEHVCKDLRRWMDEGRQIVPVSVNLSRCHFEDTHLFENIMEIIDRYEIPHEYIEIELTETTTDVDFQDLKDIVMKLKQTGISTAVDDFGVGYSSLNLIRDLPWDVVKLDKSLVSGREDSPHNQMMLSHIISMAKEFGIRCLAEGVESIEQVNMLKECGCMMAQGFYFDKPLPVEEFELKLKKV